MRKLSISALTILCISLLLFSCKKDEAILYGPAQYPVETLSEELLYIGATVNVGLPLTAGMAMEILKDGRIKELCVRVPDNGSYSVRLWNLADTSVITSVTIPADVASTSCLSISEVRVRAGQILALSLHTWDFYIYQDELVQDIYPVNIGDIRLLNYIWTADQQPTVFPSMVAPTELRGIVDIKFEPELE
ncbi:MAG: hypothetical protein GY751_06080 [Bacteroidetes bacterium]|nr:hypothetical protein [Bacteroidota bacterium]